MTGIGIGTSDFKKLRLKQYYYIDKTEYIKHIIDNKSEVILVTRPRRFGKTLNMSMLKYYFDCTDKYNKELFKGLKIMEAGEKYTSKMGYYPCIYMTLKGVSETNYENMLLSLKTEAMEIYQQHRYLLDSEKIYTEEKEKIKEILFAREDEITLRTCVRELTKYLYREHGKPVMLFLDEYDVPLQTAYVEGYYDEAIRFFKTFYGQTFKDNPYLEKTVITGVSRVAKESIFSRSK